MVNSSGILHMPTEAVPRLYLGGGELNHHVPAEPSDCVESLAGGGPNQLKQHSLIGLGAACGSDPDVAVSLGSGHHRLSVTASNSLSSVAPLVRKEGSGHLV